MVRGRMGRRRLTVNMILIHLPKISVGGNVNIVSGSFGDSIVNTKLKPIQ
jgi:hypothetical protein